MLGDSAMTRTGGWLFCALALLLLTGPARAQEPEPAQEEATEETQPQTVEERLDDLDQKVRVLERQGELDKEQAADKAKTTASVTGSRDGFSIRSADGNFQVKIRGYVQLDGRFWLDDEERPATDTFLLRRVRPIVEGTMYKIFDFRIMPDFGGGTTVLQDAYLDARFTPGFKLRVGKFKAPVGLERLQSGTDLLFVERAHPTSLVPNRDVGVQVHGDFAGGGVSYAVGLFNGTPDGGSVDVDVNDGKDLAARLFFQPFLAGGGPLKGLGFGIAATSGDQEGTVAAPGLAGYRTPGQQTFFGYRSDATPAGTVIADGDRFRLSPQGYFYSGPFGLLAEYAVSRHEVRRAAVAEELEHTAWQVAASWVLTGGEASFRSVNPKKVFDREAGTWGAFELAARVSRLELDDATFPTFANPASSAGAADSWAVGFNWYFNRNVKWYLDYERTAFEGGAASGDREDESIVFSRFQIAF